MSLVLSGRLGEEERGPAASGLRLFAALPVPSRVFIASVIAVGFGWLALRAQDLDPPGPFVYLAPALLAALAARLGLDLPLVRARSVISLACVFDFGALLLLGPDVASLIAATVTVARCTMRPGRRVPPFVTLFNIAALVLTVQATGAVYTGLGGVPSLDRLPGPGVALAAAASACFLVNVALIGTAIALADRRPLGRVLDRELAWSALHHLGGAGLATLAACVIVSADHRLALGLVLPLYFSYRTYRAHVRHVEQAESRAEAATAVHLETIEALARAIEAKDQTTTCHVRRIHVYAAGLARAAGLPPDEVQGVRTAALLHDIGKLAVPEHILSKPGALTPEESLKLRIHPQVGAEILAGVAFPYPVAELVLAHHERWDGGGYPGGLEGEGIPLGARILAVVDSFDSLLSDRPAEGAPTLEAAVERLRDEAGKSLDPKLVELFVAVLPELEAELERRGAVAPLPALVSSGTETDGPADGDGAGEPRTAKHAYHDIARARREVSALYEIAQAMGTSLGVGDTMALIASKLSPLVPFSSCALFLYAEDSDSLACRFATGVDGDLLRQLTLPNGQGVVGWVGRNLRPLVNARPKADFEAAGISAPTTLHSALVCPLVFGGRLIGALALYNVSPAAFTDDHRRLLDRICEQAGGVVHNSVLYEQTKRDSLTDPLTGLPNTRFMFVHLSRELARAKRLGAEVSLLVLDLDRFKEINDRYGHHVGDRALREVARVFQSETRPYDICVRYAGDEFVIVLSGCGPEEAEAKRGELQEAVARVDFEVRPALPLKLSISCGSASFPRDGETYETLLSTADKRMYENKAERRRTADPAPAEPEARRPSVFAKIGPQPAPDRTH